MHASHDLAAAIRQIEASVPTPEQRLPEDVFLLLSRLTPLLNVDLLIRDETGRTLLVWREDAIFGRGWHVPGGVVRLNESCAARIAAVAAGELGARVELRRLLGVYETVVRSRAARTHHLSLLFACVLADTPETPRVGEAGAPRDGEWDWHARCPEAFLQPAYRDLLNAARGVDELPETVFFNGLASHTNTQRSTT